MRHLNRLPIWRDANCMLVLVEELVRGFTRYHKYSIGTELRQTALRLCQTIHRACSRQGSKVRMVQQASELVDDLKMQIQLARELRAFRGFAQFQQAAELAVSLGRQVGGWLRQARAEARRTQSASRDPIHCAPASPGNRPVTGQDAGYNPVVAYRKDGNRHSK